MGNNNNENLNNNEYFGEENAKKEVKEEVKDKLYGLEDEVYQNIDLTKIGKFEGGIFVIRDDIKEVDENGRNYIEFGGNKYYEKLGNDEEGLGYSIYKMGDLSSIYIGSMKGKSKHGYGIEIFSDGRKYEGKWENNLDEPCKYYHNIQLANLGKFDEEWNFKFNDNIKKGKDNNGEYIEINEKKYYENGGRSGKGLGYMINKGSNEYPESASIYIGDIIDGNFKNGYGAEYFSDGRRYVGERKNNLMHGHGFEVLNGSTFNGNYIEGDPVYAYEFNILNENLSSTYTGGIKPDRNFHYHGIGTVTYNNGDSYDGEWYDGKKQGIGTYISQTSNGKSDKYEGQWINNRRHGEGTMHYSSGHIYNGHWTDGNRNGHGILTYPSGTTLEGDWIDDNFKEGGYGVEIRDGEKYEGDFLLDKNNHPKPFYYINEGRNINVYRDWVERQIQEGGTQAVLNLHMKGKLTLQNGSSHEFEINNGSIKESANDFITMYGDRKPDEDRSKERGNIEYTITRESDCDKYKMSSRKRSIDRKLEGGFFKFENKKGEILSIPQNSNFGEREAMHAANLINKARYVNANAHYNNPYGYSIDNEQEMLHATNKRRKTYGNPRAMGTYVNGERKYENGTILIQDVKKHFGGSGGISAKELAEWLNGGL